MCAGPASHGSAVTGPALAGPALEGAAHTGEADPTDAGAVWPDESAESAFLSERNSEVDSAARAPIAQVPESDPLPPLDALVSRIPAEVRAAVEELFRGKFLEVRRVPESALKK